MKEPSTDNRYRDNLSNPRFRHEGCHSWIMSTMNYGVLAGISPEEMFADVREVLPRSNVPDKEITDAVAKAMADHDRGTFTPKPRPAPVVNDGKTALQRIIDQGRYSTDAELIKASPIPIPDDPQRHTKLFVETRNRHDDLLFIGKQYDDGIVGETIKDGVDWITYWIEGGQTAPHIIINPLSGLPALAKTGDKRTYRGDNNVKNFRYCLAEFDTVSREDQIKFWSAVKLPIVALIDSGGKSIHAWLQVSRIATVKTLEQWDTEIRGRLYDRILTPLGVDSACSNPARLSRLPGHFREEKQAWQRLLWLSPEGVSL